MTPLVWEKMTSWGDYPPTNIDVDNSPCVDYFPRETVGCPHFFACFPWGIYSTPIFTRTHVPRPSLISQIDYRNIPCRRHGLLENLLMNSGIAALQDPKPKPRQVARDSQVWCWAAFGHAFGQCSSQLGVPCTNPLFTGFVWEWVTPQNWIKLISCCVTYQNGPSAPSGLKFQRFSGGKHLTRMSLQDLTSETRCQRVWYSRGKNVVTKTDINDMSQGLQLNEGFDTSFEFRSLVLLPQGTWAPMRM